MILTLRQELYRRLGSTSDNVIIVPVLGDLVLFVCFLFKILLKNTPCLSISTTSNSSTQEAKTRGML